MSEYDPARELELLANSVLRLKQAVSVVQKIIAGEIVVSLRSQLEGTLGWAQGAARHVEHLIQIEQAKEVQP